MSQLLDEKQLIQKHIFDNSENGDANRENMQIEMQNILGDIPELSTVSSSEPISLDNLKEDADEFRTKYPVLMALIILGVGLILISGCVLISRVELIDTTPIRGLKGTSKATSAPSALKSAGWAAGTSVVGSGAMDGSGDVLYFHPLASTSKLVDCGQPMYGNRLGPAFVLLGVQKAGTTSVRAALMDAGLACSSAAAECHMFDNAKWARTPVSSSALDSYENQWLVRQNKGGCAGPRFEKTPGYYDQEWAPLRMCQSLGATQKVVLFLRDPVARAYSSFYQGAKDVDLPISAAGFDQLVQLEISIVRECGGLPTGNLTHDLQHREGFATCCNSVTTRLGITNWAGCHCKFSSRPVKCGVFGDRYHSEIRRGIYAPAVRNWLQFFPAQNVFIYVVEESVFSDMRRVIWELACDVGGAELAARPDECASNTRLGKVEAMNSQTKGKEEMWASTHKTLSDFYAAYNRDLETVLGRAVHW